MQGSPFDPQSEPGDRAPIAPPYATTTGPQTGSVNSTMLLVMGILCVLFCNILGPVVWVMSNNALATIDSGAAPQSQRGEVVTARVLGIISTVLLILGLLIGIVVIVAMFAAAGTASRTAPPPTFTMPQTAPPIR